MNTQEVDENLSRLDGRGSDSEYTAVKCLAALGEKFPELMLQKYRTSKKWGERASCVYHSIKYARTNPYAYQLGLEALAYRSKNVRYRACMLLAVAQNSDAICHLTHLLNDSSSKADAQAAIDAITSKNHNYFVDRDHSGKVTLNVLSA